ncbi:MAG: transcriptional regulator [Tistrella sp.]|uniref:Transcriptional regulator n=1 Tax=Tistrella mobilis TaxID=171437 RepID=A0A3B9IP20_9PROT|nr:S24 family peptidase [Tistrella sp.]MAD39541.1 transcriptional regulator [Tistrella sp.]MBA74886.1 transcriptional regulator [Tistrella sp.]HAE49476.1 transcriptional regulator [Tistrella mobilis]
MTEKTGIPLGTISKYVAQSSTASFANAAKIARAAGITLDDMAFGSGMGASRSERVPDGPDLVRLPRYNVEAAAGAGISVTSELVTDVVAFERAFLRDLGAAPDRCSVIWARGDSMVPTIPDGSILVVDHSQIELVHGCIYVVNLGGDLLVKRLRRRLDSTVELVSDNQIYPVEALRPADLEHLRVIGRVVYFCRVP